MFTKLWKFTPVHVVVSDPFEEWILHHYLRMTNTHLIIFFRMQVTHQFSCEENFTLKVGLMLNDFENKLLHPPGSFKNTPTFWHWQNTLIWVLQWLFTGNLFKIFNKNNKISKIIVLYSIGHDFLPEGTVVFFCCVTVSGRSAFVQYGKNATKASSCSVLRV